MQPPFMFYTASPLNVTEVYSSHQLQS